MKYFTGKLWKEINSGDRELRARAKAEWDRNNARYTKIYQKEKERFPAPFIELHEANQDFHDALIKRITIKMEDWSKRSCEIVLSDGERVFELVFHHISSFMMHGPSFCNGRWNALFWGYDEFGHMDRRLTLSVLCDFENEFSLVFQTVTVNVREAAPNGKP